MNNSSNIALNNWNKQIELFATYFIEHACLIKNKPFKLLDVGCGTGAAIRIFNKKYSNGKYFGCDLESEHVKISKELHSKYGEFFVSDIQSLNSYWEIIYLSNVLEHLNEWQDKVSQLLTHTSTLYILVPYLEKDLLKNRDMENHSQHINSFDKNSFEFLSDKGYKIHQRVILTPYAWGPGLIENLINKFKNDKNYKRELLVCITNKNKRPFQPLIISMIYFFFDISKILFAKYFKAKT